MSEVIRVGGPLGNVSEFEIAYFIRELRKVENLIAKLELVKKYGREKGLDLGALNSKSVKGNSTPDIIDLRAIDFETDLVRKLFTLCRQYEETVIVDVWQDGQLVKQVNLPPVESADPAVMVEYLSDAHALRWMSKLREFEESAVEIVEVIRAITEYTSERQVEKPREVLGLEFMADRFRDTVEDYPRTPSEIVRIINKAGYPLPLKRVTYWIEQDQLEPVGMVGKRAGYLLSDVLDRYLKYIQKAARKSFVNKVA